MKVRLRTGKRMPSKYFATPQEIYLPGEVFETEHFVPYIMEQVPDDTPVSTPHKPGQLPKPTKMVPFTHGQPAKEESAPAKIETGKEELKPAAEEKKPEKKSITKKIKDAANKVEEKIGVDLIPNDKEGDTVELP